MASALPDLSGGLRRAVRGQILQLVGSKAGELDLTNGDAGLFGPGSMAWKVHGDFTSMMVGGISALLLQMLHPGALAGVWDHSNFRGDMSGRLRRTAGFIAGTTYGSTQEAERLIGRVRAIHRHVRGVLPNGTPYSADDPHLLTWVHVAEARSFLAAYLRYRDPRCPVADQDRYYTESAIVAERLGATGVPKSVRAVDAYCQAIRPELRYDARTAEMAQALLSQPAPSRGAEPFRAVTMAAALDLLPDWARRMHGRRRQPLAHLGIHGAGRLMRWALRDGARAQAERRAAALR